MRSEEDPIGVHGKVSPLPPFASSLAIERAISHHRVASCTVIYIGRISGPQIAFLNTTRRPCPLSIYAGPLFAAHAVCHPKLPPPLSLPSYPFATLRAPPSLLSGRRRHRRLPSRTHILRVFHVGFFEKGVPYIIVVITNGIIGYRDSVAATEGRSVRANLPRCRRDTSLANGGKTSSFVN